MAVRTAGATARRGARLSLSTRNQILGLLFISPWLIGLLAFTAYPILSSLYYSFTLYDIINPPRFIGLQNFIFMFTQDKEFPIVMGNTLYLVIIGVPLGLVVSFLLAVLLNNSVAGRPVFRTIFFLPSIVPVIATAMVWLWVYNPNYGVINASLAAWGFHVVPWLSSPALAKLSIIIIQVWLQGAAIVIFLAALQDVPRELYEAAKVDGAATFRRFLSVTIPMCTPSILFVLITGLIGAFQEFSLAWILTRGGPMESTTFYGIYLYQNAFQFFKMGYASALAWILFLIIVTFTFITFRTSARWVYYAGG
jgi:multiple sugar transport system permease protein